MSLSKDSIQSTLIVTLLLCVVCSIVVSSAAVVLKPRQDANKVLDRNKNILAAAGLFDPEINSDAEVPGLFSQFTPRVLDIRSGELLSAAEVESLGIDIETYDQRLIINDPNLSEAIPAAEDDADVKRRALYPMVYLVEQESGLETIVLPISGYGLWGILYGYIALEGDANTIRGLAYYELKETPGLGAEVRNPRWTALWPGKKVYTASGDVGISVVKGAGSGDYEIDGLSGATLTSQGVDNMLKYWLGEDGFEPFLQGLAQSIGD